MAATERCFQIPADCKTLLIGEGRNDARFLAALARDLGNSAACTHSLNGSDDKIIGEFANDLKAAVQTGGFRGLHSFALVLDADKDGKSALKKINRCMKECFAVCADFAHAEVRPVQVRGEKILAGVFVMPGHESKGQIKGALETLVIKAARETNQEAMECVDMFRKCARAACNGQVKDEPKKIAQAFLSALPKNAPLLGGAAQKGLIDFSAPAYSELKKFLQKLSP